MVNETRQNSMEEQVLSPAGESNHQPSEDAQLSVMQSPYPYIELETINTTLKIAHILWPHGLSSPYAKGSDLSNQASAGSYQIEKTGDGGSFRRHKELWQPRSVPDPLTSDTLTKGDGIPPVSLVRMAGRSQP